MSDTPGPYPAPALVECEVCGGMGAMTARSVDADPTAPPSVIPCPVCEGRGGMLRAFPAPAVVVRDA